MRRAVLGLLLLVSAVSAQTWLNWSEWNGNCKVAGTVAQSRFRTCQPVKEGPMVPCDGDTIEVLPCAKCPAQGTWGEWTAFDGCSEFCGAFGRRFRTRDCTKPIGCPNAPCQGEARELDEAGEPCDNQSPCLLPRRSCHADYRMSIDMDETRTKCVKKDMV